MFSEHVILFRFIVNNYINNRLFPQDAHNKFNIDPSCMMYI